MLVAAARRFLLLLGGTAALTVAVSLGLGALAGASAARSISLGLYLVGSVVLIGGFFVGNRGPLRLRIDEHALPFWGTRGVRRATADEREEAVNLSALLIVIGFLLIAFGVVTDSRFDLF